MQIVAKGVRFVVLASTVLACSKSPNSIQNKILSGDNYKKITVLIATADSLAEFDPDSCLAVVNDISKQPSDGKAKEIIDAYTNQIKGVAEVSTGAMGVGFQRIEQSHAFFLELNDSLALAESYRRKGYALREMNKYDEAIQCIIEALSITEAIKSNKNIAYLNNALGLLFMKTGNNEKALNYLHEAKRLYEKENNQFGLSKVYNNLGGTYYNMSQNILALENLEKAYELKKKLGGIANIGNTVNNIGLVCLELKLYNKAADYFIQALQHYQRNNDMWGEANTQNNLARIHIESNNIAAAKSILQKNKSIIERVNTPDLRQEWNYLSFKTNKAEGNSAKALECYINYTTIKDSIFTQKKQKTIEDIQEKYESIKKEKEIGNLNKLRSLQESKLRMQGYFGILLSLLFILLVIFSYVLFRKYRFNKKEHRLLKAKQLESEKQNSVLNKALKEIEIKTEQLKKQRDIAKEQKNQIQYQKEEITNSIRYASRIQSAILETKDLNRSNIPPHFGLFRPKDIVSGDFYWIRELEHYSVFAVADCTGHGVPGAFMSLLGIAFLNEIFSDKQKIAPHEILNALRAKIITALHQNSTDPINNDGMDIAILFIDNSRKKILFSGANLSLFVVRKSELIEIHGDKMPVGFYYAMNPFETRTMEIESGDCLYLATDGFADQFGGPDKKKFMLKGLKNILLQIADKPLEQQKNILECSFDAWKGNGIQVDDVLVLGIRV